jgi:hypothetical protein
VLNVSVTRNKKTTQPVVSKMDDTQKRLFDLFKMDEYLAS